MPPTDQDLLDRYLSSHDEAAFRLLVERHLPLVHGVARRVTGNEEMARDVSQRTLIRLAERAALVPRHASLAAWLHRIARDLAVDLIRSEDRRKKRETAALLNPAATAMDEVPEPAWSALAPLIDEMVAHLPAADRDLVLLRFYQNEPHAAIARRLGVTEQAARKRSLRALEKLRVLLGKRGIATTASALWTLLPAHAATPVPPALMTSVLSGVQGVAPHLPGGLQVALHTMNSTQKSLVAGAAVVFLLSAAYSLRPGEETAAAGISTSATAGTHELAGLPLRPRNERLLPVDAAGRLERLREILAIPSHVSRTREMVGFVDLLSPAQFQETAENLQQLEALNSDMMIVFGPSWAKLDPLNAAEWSSQRKGMLWSHILTSWGAAEPQVAIAWVAKRFPDAASGTGTGDPNDANPMAQVLCGAVSSDPAAVAGFLANVTAPRAVTEFVARLARAMEGGTPGGSEALLKAMPPGPVRSELVSRCLVYMICNHQGGRALDLLVADEGAMKFTPLDQFFGQWSMNDAPGLKAHLEKMPDGPLQQQAVIAFCQGAHNAEVVEAFELMRRYPVAATDVNIAKIADYCPIEHSALALDQIIQMHTESARDEIMTRRLTWWRARDADAAARWMDAHDLPAAVKEAVKNASAKP